MTEFIVINTGPLITLSRINAIDAVSKLPFKFVCPCQVREELDEGIISGHSYVSTSWLNILPLKENLSRIILASLDRGEAAVIQLVIEQNNHKKEILLWKLKTVICW